MPRSGQMRSVAGHDPQITRMVGVSALLHGTLLFALLVVLPLVKPGPLPMIAYTVELTDSSSLGGRLAPGKTDLPMGPRAGASEPSEAPAKLGDPEVKPEPPPPPKEAAPVEPEPPKPIEHAKAPEPPKPPEPAVKLPSIEKPPPPKPE